MAKAPASKAKTTTKKTTAKSAASKKTLVPNAASDNPNAAPRAAIVNAPEKKTPYVADATEAMKKRELINLVTLRSGIKKKDARPVVEAMLEVLGEALHEGRDLNLLPLGKTKVTKTKQVGNGRLIVARIRQKDTSVVDVQPTTEAPQAAE